MDNVHSNGQAMMGFTSMGDTGATGEAMPKTAPWGVRDVAAAIFFGLAAIVTALGAVQTVNLFGEGSEKGAAAAIAVGLAGGLALGIAKLSGVRLLPAFLSLLGISAVSGGLAAAGGNLSDSDAKVLGVPATIILFSLVEGIFFVTAWLYANVKHGTPFAALGFVRPNGIKPYLMAVLLWCAAAVGIGIWVVAIRAIGIDLFSTGDGASDALEFAGGSVLIAVALVGILGPIAEEVFFRGFVLNGLRSRYGMRIAIVGSSAIFGMFHVAPGVMMVTFILGLAFAVIYVRTKSLWPAILAHSLQNTLAIIAASMGQS